MFGYGKQASEPRFKARCDEKVKCKIYRLKTHLTFMIIVGLYFTLQVYPRAFQWGKLMVSLLSTEDSRVIYVTNKNRILFQSKISAI